MTTRYNPETDRRDQLVSAIMWQKARCEKCGRTWKVEISFTASRDGNAVEKLLDVTHRASSPYCLGRPGKPRHVGEGKFMAGDFLTMDRGPAPPPGLDRKALEAWNERSERLSLAWAWQSREGHKPA